MQYLENNGFNGVCPSQIDCNIQNTVVTCGTITGRKKRWTDVFIREKRSTHKIRVEITMETTWFDFNSTGGATFYFLEDIQKSIFNVIKASSVAGDLTVRGLSPDINSFALGWSDPDCPDGHSIRWSTLTCGMDVITILIYIEFVIYAALNISLCKRCKNCLPV